MKLELTEGDSLEVSDDTPMYNPHIIFLKQSLIQNKVGDGLAYLEIGSI